MQPDTFANWMHGYDIPRRPRSAPGQHARHTEAGLGAIMAKLYKTGAGWSA